jgi:small subunit ribosomal protein S4
MSDPKCKICRRAGEKLFLKGAKCFTPKCTFEKKPTPPGKPLSERKHRSTVTEYGVQMREKQKVRNVYGLREKQFSRYVEEAMSVKGGNPVDRLYQRLEHRLDNIVFRLGLANSRVQARQMVNHGHVVVNGTRTDIPSALVKTGSKITVREGSKGSPMFASDENTARRTPPNWLTFVPEKLAGEVTGTAKYEKGETGFDFQQVIEFYSR